MPLIDLTYPEGVLDDAQRAELVARLQGALLAAERAPDNEFVRSITWVHVHELPRQAMLAGGRPAEAFRVDVTTPEGALSERRRTELIAAATEAVAEVAGIADRLQIWVICHEVREGSWGAAGHVVEFSRLAEAAAAGSFDRSGA